MTFRTMSVSCALALALASCGAPPPSLVNLVPEPAGSHCSSGGTAVQSGIDANRDGILAESEVTSTAYICNGDKGAQTLVSLVPEPPGQNCAGGGTAVQSGSDTNGNGTLDATEVSSKQYICAAGSVFPTKWAYAATEVWSGDLFSSAFVEVNGPVRIFKTSPTSRLKITVNDAYRTNASYAGGGGSWVGIRVNGSNFTYNGQYTRTWTSGGASYGNDFHLPYSNVVVTEQLPVGVYDFDLVAQGVWTGQVNGMGFMGWGQGVRSMLVEEIDGNTFALNQSGDDVVTTSATLVQAPGRNVTYNKKNASTLLKLTYSDTLRVGEGQSPGTGMVMIRMDGADTTCQFAQYVHVGGSSAAADIHHPFVETCVLAGVAPGDHTFTVWFKSMSGGQAYLGWGRWHRTLLVEEVPTAGRSYQTTSMESGELSGGWAGVPGRQVTHTVSAPGRTVKVTFSDDFRANKGCNGTAGSYQIFIDGNPSRCYGAEALWNGGPSPSNDQHYPINQTCIFHDMSAGPHVFAVYSTSNNIYSGSPTTCGSNDFGWNRGQSLILVEELP